MENCNPLALFGLMCPGHLMPWGRGTTPDRHFIPSLVTGYGLSRNADTAESPDPFAHIRPAAAGVPAVVAELGIRLWACLRPLLPDGHYRLLRRLSRAVERNCLEARNFPRSDR